VIPLFLLLLHDPVTTKLTWTQEISRIVDRHCIACHSDFKAYASARPWAKAIRDEVASRRMPPWGVVKGVGDFVGDPSLSGPEIDMVVAWAEGGAPEGDPAYLPHRLPSAAAAPALPRYAKAIAVHQDLLLKQPTRVVALRPVGPTEAWAVRPDGQIDRLIWLNDYLKASPRDYIPRDPPLLPAGTRLKVQGSALTFYLR
jgi:hypothetical protein